MGEFTKDLKIGQHAQNYIIKELSEELPGLKSIQGNFSNYDLVSDDGYTIEVKFDIKSKLTDNIAIEYEYNRKPSGIAKTKAIEWIHIYYMDDGWVFSRLKIHTLKEYLRSNWKYFKKLEGGDNNSSKIVLIPIDDFADVFNFVRIAV